MIACLPLICRLTEQSFDLSSVYRDTLAVSLRQVKLKTDYSLVFSEKVQQIDFFRKISMYACAQLKLDAHESF